MSRQPWMKFYPADWQSDHLLRSCSIAARGLWIELLCIMQKAEPIGHLLVNGKAPTHALLGVLCGVSTKEIGRLLAELEAAGVFDIADGVIVSRRMIRDAEKAERDKANGRLGGNPKVKEGVNPHANPEGNGEDKAHIPEARVQNKTLGAKAPGEPAPPDHFEDFWRAYPNREGPNPKKPARQRFDRLVANGTDPVMLVDAAKALAREHLKPTRFVPQAITFLNQERFDDDGSKQQQPAPTVDWAKRLRYGRHEGAWWQEWGPAPDMPNTLVPADLIEDGDGIGWRSLRYDS